MVFDKVTFDKVNASQMFYFKKAFDTTETTIFF